MDKEIKTFQQAQQEKISLAPEYPNYWIDMAGKVCYKRLGKFYCCKKLANGKIKMFINGVECEVNETTIANKYVPEWSKFRKKNKTKGSQDGRYKGNADIVDKGAMSHLKIEMPEKPKKINKSKYLKIERSTFEKLVNKLNNDPKMTEYDLRLVKMFCSWIEANNLENNG